MGQRGRDPVRGPAQHELLHQQPGHKPRGEPALRDRFRHRRRGQHPADRAAATPPVGRAAGHHPDQPDLPVDQLAALLTERDVAGSAARAHPLALRDVADLLLGREMGVVPATVAPRPLLLPTTTTTHPSGSRALGATLTGRLHGGLRGGLLGSLPGRLLLRGLPERQPGQLRDLLGQRPDLALQLDDPVPQQRGLRLGPLGPRPPALRFGTPEPDVTTKIAVAAHDRARRSPSAPRVQHPNPACRAPGTFSRDGHSYGITEYLPSMYPAELQIPSLRGSDLLLSAGRWSPAQQPVVAARRRRPGHCR